MTLISSMGIHSDLDGLPAAEAREASRIVNEEWADAQRRHPGRFFGAAAFPLQDTAMAIEELEHAVEVLGLRGVSIPGSIAGEPIDAPRLEPFYARVAELGVPMFIHPTDGVFVDSWRHGHRQEPRARRRLQHRRAALILSGLFDRPRT